jgi:hypothetical protein
MQRSTRLLTLTLAVLPAAGGCYHYVPLAEPTAPVAEGTSVRVHLSAPRSFDVSGFTAHGVGRVDGALVERRGDAWVVAANSLYASGGNRFDAGAFVLDVPNSSVASTEVRTHSWWRTGVAGVAGLVGIYFLSEAMRGTSTSGTDGPGNGGERVVIPLP